MVFGASSTTRPIIPALARSTWLDEFWVWNLFYAWRFWCSITFRWPCKASYVACSKDVFLHFLEIRFIFQWLSDSSGYRSYQLQGNFKRRVWSIQRIYAGCESQVCPHNKIKNKYEPKENSKGWISHRRNVEDLEITTKGIWISCKGHVVYVQVVSTIGWYLHLVELRRHRRLQASGMVAWRTLQIQKTRCIQERSF